MAKNKKEWILKKRKEEGKKGVIGFKKWLKP